MYEDCDLIVLKSHVVKCAPPVKDFISELGDMSEFFS